MADKNFGQFTNQTSPATGDFVVGYRGTSEQRYTLHSISGLIVGEGGDGQGLTAAKNLGSSPSIGVLSGVAGTTGVWLKSLSGKGTVSLTENDSTIFISGTSDSLWTENGSNINYTAGQVSIGTTELAAGSALVVSGNQYQQTIYGPNSNFKGVRFISQDADPVFASDREGLVGMAESTTKRDGDIGAFYLLGGQSNDVWVGNQGTVPNLVARTADRTTTPYTLSTFIGDPEWGSALQHELRVSGKLYITGGNGDWVQLTGNGGGGGDSSPLTTKGDLYGFDTANARIPVGSNGQVLTADSTESLGLKWADSAAGCAISDWVEAFEEDGNGDLMPASSNCVNDTMWKLNSDNSLSLRSNHFRYNWGAAAFTEDVSF